jgi:hypothetical protein
LRCKVCSLPKEKRELVKKMMFQKIPLRRISDILKQNGLAISYAAISRHGHHVLWVKRKLREIDCFLDSKRRSRPVVLTVNLDGDVWRTLRRKRTLLSCELKRRGNPDSATMSSVANYFLEKGVDATLDNSETAERALRCFLRRRVSFRNRRKKRLRGRLATIMMNSELNGKLQADIQLQVWHSKSIEELYRLWSETVARKPEDCWGTLPHPSLTDYVNLVLRVGLGLGLEN